LETRDKVSYDGRSVGPKEDMTLGQFYRIAVWSFLVTMALLVVLNLVGAIVGRESFQNLPFLIRLPLGTLGAFSAIGIIALWIGMMWNCVATTRLPTLSRIGWGFLLVFTNMLGALIYYYVVYQR